MPNILPDITKEHNDPARI